MTVKRSWLNLVSRRRLQSTALVLAVFFLPGFPAPPSAQAQTLTVLHSFTGGSDGAFPSALIRDSAGNLYGTAYEGGNATCFNPSSCGTVFKLDSSAKLTVLYSFKGKTDGANPASGIIRDSAGNLFGTAQRGGDLECLPGVGCGTVFKLNPSGKEIVLHIFTGLDGMFPGALVRDEKGNFYGTTGLGGDVDCFNYAYRCGTVFKLDTARHETVLYSFTGGADGANPSAGVIRDAAGNLYGTTYGAGDQNCGSGCGTVFKLNAAGALTVLHSFTGGADGSNTSAGLTRDAAGNLYGTAPYGTWGTIFRLNTNGQETVLYDFTGGADGQRPSGPVIRDAAGNLYGTTALGGAFKLGTVFKLDAAGNETVLHSFAGGADGAYPSEGVIQDSAGNLYGTTSGGGDLTCNQGIGCGIIFKLTP